MRGWHGWHAAFFSQWSMTMLSVMSLAKAATMADSTDSPSLQDHMAAQQPRAIFLGSVTNMMSCYCRMSRLWCIQFRALCPTG